MYADANTLGVVTEGTFNAGLTVRLSSNCSTESLRVGSFVVLEGERNHYFSLITDIRLRVTDNALAAAPPLGGSPFVRRALAGSHAYATVEVRPSLMLEDAGKLSGSKPGPVRNIPMHFAVLREATAVDFDHVFGEESTTRFALGTPPTMDIKIPIDLEELVKRSNGIFGQSGTGKSVLTRLLLFGIIKSDVASVLVFDMHGEYARQSSDEPEILGLVDLFGKSKVVVYSLEEGRGSNDFKIGLSQIEPGDIELLAEELNLTGTYGATTHQLSERFGNLWLQRLIEMSPDVLEHFCSETGAHPAAVNALKQKLAVLKSRDYILEQAQTTAIDDLLGNLQRGKHVILQFGRYQSFLDYMLVANIVTRRIHQKYTEQVLRQTNSPNGTAAAVRRLVIVLEEAHKFLAPEAAKQSIFGTIAREMRKYAVTLLVVDQRPSGIDPEVMSQIGTRITGLLTDQRDIDAVLTGVSDRNQMRGMLATLRPKQECLILGHAMPMPIMLRTRTYDGPALRQEIPKPTESTLDPEWLDKVIRGEED
ncbi:MAG TPA: ATP-binding protein [Nitrolancea sp.]|nr:ATP-binding protein [Nitrolancea sp.]